MTFSIAARCPETGMMGLAIASSSIAVAARCAHARGQVGVVLSQNVTDPGLGRRGLDLLEFGAAATPALNALIEIAPHVEHRQLAILDRWGGTAAYSGRHALGIYATEAAADAVAAGNLLATPEVPAAMVAHFVSSNGPLGDRLIAALEAGLAAGGEAGPVHSAGLMLVAAPVWPVADLRIDWRDEAPVEALAELWRRYRPQLDAYVARALDPGAAPAYGVPGET